MAFRMEAWFGCTGGCYAMLAACSVCSSVPLTSEHSTGTASIQNKKKKAYLAYIFCSRSEGRNVVAIFGKRESPQLRIFFGAVDVSSSEYIY